MNPRSTSPTNLQDLRIEQARMLRSRVKSSCITVLIVIAFTSTAYAFAHTFLMGLAWAVIASAMVAVTYFYAVLAAPQGSDGLNRTNYARFLKGHIAVSCLTGFVWSGFAIYQMDLSSFASIFIGIFVVSNITMGGVLPSSAYRPTYIGLASCSLLPLGLYLLFSGEEYIQFVGGGVIFYYLFIAYISTRVEFQTLEMISTRHAQMLVDKISEKNELIRRSAAEKTRFLTATGHDLSQPLHAQRFFMQTLRGQLTSDEQHETLDKIEHSWSAQNQLLQAVVDISRLDSGAITPNFTTVDLEKEVRKLTSEFVANSEKSLKLHSDFAAVKVNSDPALLSRILRNLLSNAQKYTPSGGTVEFVVRQQDDHALVILTNSGVAIPQEDQSRIFDEYEQYDGPEPAKGLGLGLSIVRRLAHLLGIEVALTSNEEIGTRFTLTIPVAQDYDTQPPATSKPRKAAKGFAGMPLVVLVDDREEIVEAMTGVISSWNCQLISASSAAEAYKIVQRARITPAALIVDKNLGKDEDGLDLIGKIREEKDKYIPAILMSGDTGDLESAARAANVHLLNKPVDPDNLYIMLADILG